MALSFLGRFNLDGKEALTILFKGFEEEVHFEEEEVECESTLSFLTRKELLELCKVVFELEVATTLPLRRIWALTFSILGCEGSLA